MAVTVKLAEDDKPVEASVAVNSICAVPAAAGVTVTVGNVTVPPTTTPEAGTMVRFSEAAVTVT